jgi:mortality factor 4-like protein 1
VPQDRLRKFTEENRELATTLRREAEAALRQKTTKTPAKKRGGSDRSSARGSEERQTSVPGRGTKRARDNDVEKVC